ncbi:MAG TPA: MoxR family ATPase [Candidatus Dormibacteraeota bacterium]|jgi:MoxR-like ATPase|nr:MoxR family ATPase [Candidatus Dormibacteraeota bacterium]
MNVDVQAMARRLQESLGTVIVGKEAEIELCIVGLLCRGHLLIEDVPGTGKTLLAKALARSSGCTFERVQFTPDLLPGDVTGVSVYNPQAQTFEFRKGPIFAQVLLADEINRATPKTQSALLEAMEEWQVTVDGTTHHLPDPFMVLATQNPIELGGTFPLPEAQVDRFLLKLRLGYLSSEKEVAMLDRFQSGSPLNALEPVTNAAEIKAAQEVCRDIYCDAALKEYCVRVVRRTREHRDVSLGSSPRGTLGLLHAGQARAALAGRAFVLPDDIKEIATNVLEHRVMLRPNAELRGLTAAAVLEEVLATESVPMTGRRLA